MIEIKCKFCGGRHPVGVDACAVLSGKQIEGEVVRRLPAGPVGRQLALAPPVRREVAREAMEQVEVRSRGSVAGKAVLVRLQPEMLKWLDEHREALGVTRPEAIRDVLGGAMIRQKSRGL